MTDAKPQPASLEDISAGLLSGAMMTLLACAFAGFMAWQIVAELTGRLPDLMAMSASLPGEDLKTMTTGDRSAAIKKSVWDGIMILLTLGFIARGVRHIQRNLTLLRARRDARIANSSRL